MSMWLPKKTQLLGWSESLKRSGVELPADFDRRLSALRSKWDQLEVSFDFSVFTPYCMNISEQGEYETCSENHC